MRGIDSVMRTVSPFLLFYLPRLSATDSEEDTIRSPGSARTPCSGEIGLGDTIRSGEFHAQILAYNCPTDYSSASILFRKYLILREPAVGLEPQTC